MHYTSFCVFLMLTGYAHANRSDPSKATTLLHSIWNLSDSLNDLALKLHSVFSRNTQSNFVFSPISVGNTLAMLHFGAKGRTAKELEQLLCYDKANLTKTNAARAYKHLLTNMLVTSNPRYYTFELGNAIFVSKRLELNAAYKRRAEDLFRSPVRQVPFSEKDDEALTEINQWVKNRTRNRAKKIIDKVDPEVDLVVVNAVFFKGQWSFPFRMHNSRSQVFYNGGVKRKYVPMMKQENNFFYGRDNEMSILELPFKGNNLSMIFILPHKMDGLLHMEQNISLNKFLKILEITSMQRVLVTIPKFRVPFSVELSSSLQSLNVSLLFQPSSANLTGMVPVGQVAVGEIKHKAVLEIDEGGVDASATSATMTRKSFFRSDPDEEFYIDHPFMFGLLDKRNGLLLFLGRIWKF